MLFGCATTPPTSETVAMMCGNLFDSREGNWKKDQTLLIRDGLILDVNPKTLPPETRILDRSQSFVIPGLIDAHSHVFLEDSTFGKDFRKGLLTFLSTHADRDRKKLGQARLRSLLSWGFTSVRDLGNQGGVDPYSVKSGSRVYSSGPGFSPDLGQLPSGVPEEFLRREYLPLNSPPPEHFPYDVVKVYADEDPNPGVAPVGVLSRWVRWAHEQRLKVAAHGILPRGIDAAIEARVDTLEHGTRINQEQLQRLRERKIIFVPTYADVLFLLPEATPYGWSWTPEVTRMVCRNIRRARELGVSLAFGSDNYFSLESVGLEFGEATLEILLAYEACGLSGTEVIQAATYRAAQTLGLENKLGYLGPGAHADFLIFSEDPSRKLVRLKSPREIYLGGRKIKRR